MPISVEINLRVPGLTVDASSGPRRISNQDVRFIKTVEVAALPKVGDNLELSTRTTVFQATVKRVDWQDGKNGFVVACQYAERSMSSEAYDSLRADLDWTMTPLLAP